jgi:deferrochelatase/peroxidase EfeB
MVAGALQEGIDHAPGARPGRFFAIMFLRVAEHCDAPRAGQRLADLWRLYAGLKKGRIPDLDPVAVPHEQDNLRFLLGIGSNAFALDGVRRERPNGLGKAFLFASPEEEGGGSLLAGSGLDYAPDVRSNLATEEICVQVTGDTKLAVDRTIVETWKLLSDSTDPDKGVADLELMTFYIGFQRQDRRSWIDFHDGLSNMRSEDREQAIAIDAGKEDPWCVGGTYLAFMRIGVDLAAWRRLGRREQELLVGRDKLSGCPLVDAPGGEPRVDPACPVAGTQIWEEPNDPLFGEPRGSTDVLVAQSHVQRANRHVEPASGPASRRIFRQGYEFIEWQEGAPGFRAGLNFVSFQDTTERLFGMLTDERWLGRVNFGGDPDRQPPGMSRLLSIYAAGVFLAPPRRDGEPFPGASVFGL